MDLPSHLDATSVISKGAAVLHERLFNSNIGLQAILFVARNRAGPARVVAQYPLDPDEYRENSRSSDGKQTPAAYDDSSPNDTSDTPAHTLPSETGGTTGIAGTTASTSEQGASGNHDGGAIFTASQSQGPPLKTSVAKPPSSTKTSPVHLSKLRVAHYDGGLENADTIFGMRKDALAKLLIPSNTGSWHSKKFELKLGSRAFVGYPISCTPSLSQESSIEEGQSPQKAEQNESKKKDIAPDDDNVFVTEETDFEARTKQGSGDKSDEIDATEQQIPDQGEAAVDSPKEESGVNVSKPIDIAKRLPTGADGSAGNAGQHLLQQPHSLQSTMSSVSASSELERKANPLTSFNIVLVLSPPSWTHHVRIEASINSVVRPFATWLRQLQQKSDWVGKQIRRLDQLQTSWRNDPTTPTRTSFLDFQKQYTERTSPLENMLKTIFEGLKNGRTIHITGSTNHDLLSIRMPTVVSSPYLPMPLTSTTHLPALSSSCLTIANARRVHGEKQQEDQPSSINRTKKLSEIFDELGLEVSEPAAVSEHSALVIVGERQALLAQLEWSPSDTDSLTAEHGDLRPFRGTPLAPPLAYFIRHITIRRTLGQLTRASRPTASEAAAKKQTVQTPVAPPMPGLTLLDAQLLACLLIRCGAVKATLPIHASHTYVVSPTAPLQHFKQSAIEWQHRFRRLHGDREVPALAEILEKLSKPPKSPPTADNTGENPIVTRTSGIQKPWTAFIPKNSEKEMYMDMIAWLVARNWAVQIRTFAWVLVSSEVKRAVRSAASHAASDAYEREMKASKPSSDSLQTAASDAHVGAKPRHSWLLPLRSTSRPPSASGSTASARTAVMAPASSVSHRSSHEDLSRPVSPAVTDRHSEFQSSFIQSPSEASDDEQQWIDHIGEHLGDEDARRLWPTLIKYFDGAHALEEIASMEGWKRALLAGVFKSLVAEGVVKTVRHW